MVRIVKGFFDPPPRDGESWIADCRSFDIPETIERCIRNAAPGMLAITLSKHGGPQMIEAAERAAAERNAKVLWWTGPDDPASVAQLDAAIAAIANAVTDTLNETELARIAGTTGA